MNEILTKDAEQQLTVEREGIISLANELTITTEVENAKATLILKALTSAGKNVKATFAPAVDSAKLAYDEAKALRDKFLKPLTECEATLRTKISAFLTAENARREALQAKADKKFEKAATRAEATGQPLAVARTVVPTVGGGMTTWYADVRDILALCRAIGEGKADPALVLPNMPLLNSFAKNAKMERDIFPGVVARKKISVVSR